MWLFKWWLWSWQKNGNWTTELLTGDIFQKQDGELMHHSQMGVTSHVFIFRSRLPNIPKLSHALLSFHDTPNFRWTCSMEIIGNMAFVKSATVLVGMSFWQRQNFVIYRVLPTLPWRNNIVDKQNKMPHFAAAIKGIQWYQESVLDCLPNSVGR
jgi:hypothetical protein